MPDTKFSQFTDSTDFTDLVGLEGGNNAKINKDNLKKSLDILRHRVVVNQDNVSTTLGGVIDPTMEYFLDGVIDIGSNQITVPPQGMTIRGYSFDLSGLITSEPNHTMFVSQSPVIGSGDLLMFDLALTTTGLGSKIYELYDVNGVHTVELIRVNYNNCVSLGDLYNFRQGVEFETGRFGGSPSLTLHESWAGGFRVDASIVRDLDATMTRAIFAKGTNFVMQSRFLTDINCDLPPLASLLDFDSSDFPNASTLKLVDCIITRGGVSDPTDSNITPNISASNLSCSWSNNTGIVNTFIGGISTVTAEQATIITAINVPSVIEGTFTNSDMQHFDAPVNGQMRLLGSNPIEYTVLFDFILEGEPNREFRIELVLNDGVTDTVIYSQPRVINNFQGGRDVAYFTGSANVIIKENNYVYWQVVNLTDDADCTLENASSYSIKER